MAPTFILAAIFGLDRVRVASSGLKSRRFSRSFALVDFRVGAPRSDWPVDFFGGLFCLLSAFFGALLAFFGALSAFLGALSAGFLSLEFEIGRFGLFGGKGEARRIEKRTSILRDIGPCKIG